MISKVNLKIGKAAYQFEFDEPKEAESMHRAIALSNYPTYCTVCQENDTEENFKLTTNKDTKGNVYINLRHNPCGGKVKLGFYQAGGFFWHREFEVYKKTDKKETEDE